MNRTYSASRFVVYANIIIPPLAAALIIGFILYVAVACGWCIESRVTIPGAIASSLLVLGLFAPLTYLSLRTITHIRVRDDAVIEFRSPLRRISLPPSAVISVRALPLVRNSTQIRHAGGRLPLYMPVDGLYEFLTWLKQKNPSVDIRWL